MTAHSPEPWTFQCYLRHEERQYCSVYRPDGHTVAKVLPLRESEADARRIVAAVNACCGIPTEELEAAAAHPLVDPKRVRTMSFRRPLRHPSITFDIEALVQLGGSLQVSKFIDEALGQFRAEVFLDAHRVFNGVPYAESETEKATT